MGQALIRVSHNNKGSIFLIILPLFEILKYNYIRYCLKQTSEGLNSYS